MLKIYINESRGNGYDGMRMSINAENAYEGGEKPLSKWTKELILDAINKIENKNYSGYFDNWTKDQLFKLLYRSSWHHTSGAYNKTDFYTIDEDEVDKYFSTKTKPNVVTQKQPKAEIEPEFCHGKYRQVEYHPYSLHNKYIETWVDFKNAHIKGNWVILNDGHKKALDNCQIDSYTKERI